MSALTDLFTAYANKIRSKVGGSDTYTPPEMVDAIDDVYDAGVAAGATPTQSKTVTATTSQQTVTPDSGYALSSVIVDPQIHNQRYTPTENAYNDMGVNHNYRYVNTYNMYEVDPDSLGILIYENGDYDVRHHATAMVSVQASLAETVLWTNPDPTEPFAGDVVLTQSYENFSYVAIKFGDAYENVFTNVMYSVSDFQNLKNNSLYFNGGSVYKTVDQTYYRSFYVHSNNKIVFKNCSDINQTTDNRHIIPVQIIGLK